MTKLAAKLVKDIVFNDVKIIADQAESTLGDLHRATLAAYLINSEDTIKQISEMFSKTGAHYHRRQVLSNAKYLASLVKDGEKVYTDKECKHTVNLTKVKTVGELPSNIDSLRKWNKAHYKTPLTSTDKAEDTVKGPEPEPQADKSSLGEQVTTLFAMLLESDYKEAGNTLEVMFKAFDAVQVQADALTKAA